MTKIKICGITKTEEAKLLNEYGIEYAGFVFYEKSRRYLTVAKAGEILKKLNENIRKVAVTVSPNAELIKRIQGAGFDILQVHGKLSEEARREITLPVWRAHNLSDAAQIDGRLLHGTDGQADGLLLDAASYGSGRTFGWETCPRTAAAKRLREQLFLRRIPFILAGGLHAGNVADGIRLFLPDIVDVSTGVEEADGDKKTAKSREKIECFVRAVREEEEGERG